MGYFSSLLNDELRDVNDRLAVLNEELAGKNADLRATNAALDSRESELKNARDYALAVLDTVREPLLTLGPDSRVISASPPFYAMFKTNAHHTLGRSVFELGEGRLDIPELREAIQHALVVGTDFQDFVVDRDLVGLGHRTLLISGRHIHYGGGAPENVLLAIEDITERSRGQALSDALDRINLTMVSTSDYDELLERAMTEAAQALGSDEAALVIPTDGSWIARFSLHASWATAGAAVSSDVARQFSGLAAGQRAVVSTSRGKHDRLSPRDSRAQSVRVPLISRDGIVGAISFGRAGHGATFSEAELDFIDKLAPALSMALGNAEAYTNEHRIAEVLQTSLLKPLPPVSGLEIGLAYRPAHRAERVGGDFYDLFSLADGRVVAVVGDVSGKGVQAASLTETVRATLRTLTSLGLSPAQVLKRANELLMGQLPSGQFVTVLLAIVDIASAKVVISSAGHPPLVVCGEKARFLEVLPGTPLGAVTSDYAEAEFELLPTETMVLYTDGLIEARRGTDFFGEQRLIEALGGERGTNVQQMVESLVSKVTEHAGGRLADDLAVIAVHLTWGVPGD